MRFMLISYATKDWEAGLPPDPRLLAAIPRLYEKMPKGAALLSTGGLGPSALGAKVRVSGGKVLVTDGPFAETKKSSAASRSFEHRRMIVEYIRYRVPSERCVEFERAYSLAGEP